MKVYLFISKHKKTLKMYLPYIEALQQKLDITKNLDAAGNQEWQIAAWKKTLK